LASDPPPPSSPYPRNLAVKLHKTNLNNAHDLRHPREEINSREYLVRLLVQMSQRIWTRSWQNYGIWDSGTRKEM
jgi:hypothetical protein